MKLFAHTRHFAAMVALVAGVLAAADASAAQIEILPVASVTIYPGDTITDGMIADGRFAEGTTAAYPVVATRAELTGKVARRTLLPGRLIARNSVGVPDLVQKGAIVPAIFESGSLVITTSVIALQSGVLDEAIQARNVDSGKVIVGSVQADGSLRIASE
jgi:flagella basal body P-ring formation protein FlgA